MKVGIPISEGRVSPVFDVARRLLLVTCEEGRELHRVEHVLGSDDPVERARRLADLETDVLICGAISRPLESLVISAGVDVVPQTCGPVEEVLSAFIGGKLSERDYVLPGCYGHRRRCRRRGRGGRCREE